jgi:hypothetical protein
MRTLASPASHPPLARWSARVCAGLLLLAFPALAPAQQTSLTLAGFPLTTTSTTGGDYEAGAVSIGSTTFTVNATSNFPTLSPRTTTVYVTCRAACPRSGTLSINGLQWKRADQVAWTTITTGYVVVESRSVTFNGANDPWTQTVQWRYLLNWTTTAPTAASSFYIRFRLEVAAP